jgi:hypothetical protein
MRASIEHQQRTTGLGGTQSQFVECVVQFTEEELAIIRARGLGKHLIVLDHPRPSPSYREYMTAGVLQAFAPLFAFIGFMLLVLALMGSLVPGAGTFRGYAALGAFLFFGAPIGWAVGYLMDRAISHRLTNPKQFVTIRDMQLEPFTVHSPDPAYSDVIVDQIKEQLTILRAIIVRSAEVRQRQTFEIE